MKGNLRILDYQSSYAINSPTTCSIFDNSKNGSIFGDLIKYKQSKIIDHNSSFDKCEAEKSNGTHKRAVLNRVDRSETTLEPLSHLIKPDINRNIYLDNESKKSYSSRAKKSDRSISVKSSINRIINTVEPVIPIDLHTIKVCNQNLNQNDSDKNKIIKQGSSSSTGYDKNKANYNLKSLETFKHSLTKNSRLKMQTNKFSSDESRIIKQESIASEAIRSKLNKTISESRQISKEQLSIPSEDFKMLNIQEFDSLQGLCSSSKKAIEIVSLSSSSNKSNLCTFFLRSNFVC